MKKYFVRLPLLLVFCTILPYGLRAQNTESPRMKDTHSVRCMFYNTENFFDAKDDPTKDDAQFLPEGSKKWTDSKMFTKANNIAKVIIAAGEGRPVELIGLCEVENAAVIQVLLKATALSKDEYGYIHYDSNDPRGIDQALIYHKARVKVLKADTLSFISPEYGNAGRYTLYAKLLLDGLDTQHVMVAHLPSKVGDSEIKTKNRLAAAQVIRKQFDQILRSNAKANILIMGDMNDTYDSEPLAKGFALKAWKDKVCSGKTFKADRKALYDFAEIAQSDTLGTYRYKGKWDVIDHIMVSGNLLNPKEPIYCLPSSYTIGKFPFLLEDDTKYMGYRPKATYKGSYYNQGTSDHLPVWLDLFLHPIKK